MVHCCGETDVTSSAYFSATRFFHAAAGYPGHVQFHAVKRHHQTQPSSRLNHQHQHIQVDEMLMNHVYPALGQPRQQGNRNIR
jgi:hypothetical protein